jgi:hypothetical protein
VAPISANFEFYSRRSIDALRRVVVDGHSLGRFSTLGPARQGRAARLGSAKFVAFETVLRPTEIPGQLSLLESLDWPYVESLRLDEAPPNQNGAPIRVVVPWKYGGKGIKSIVRIALSDQQPGIRLLC